MISSVIVDSVFRDCLYKEEEIVDGKFTIEPIYVEGIVATFGLHPERVKQHAKEVKIMIDQLPDKFKVGWTFMNLCNTKDGDQWTGLQQQLEQLVVLGIATNNMIYCAPRPMWCIMPGGLPYIQVVEKEEV